jgi:hypothetical protein
MRGLAFSGKSSVVAILARERRNRLTMVVRIRKVGDVGDLRLRDGQP